MCSTMVTRDESNVRWEKHPHLRGVPITLKVPTHLKVIVFERHFLQKKTVGDTTVVERLKLPFVLRDYHHEFIYTEKIFTVDFKRPAAGFYNLRLDMTDDQYIDQVQHDVTDTTIEEVTKVVKKFAPSGVFVEPSALSSSKIEASLTEIESVAAVGLFEIDDPEFEMKLSGFLNCHLNQSHDAFVVPESVDQIRRVPFTGYPGDGSMCAGPLPIDGWNTEEGNQPAGYLPPMQRAIPTTIERAYPAGLTQ